MMNQEIAEIFGKMADILEFLGDPKDFYRIRAYSNVSRSIAEAPDDIGKMANENRLHEIRGVGEGIIAKIEEYINRGTMKEFEVLKKAVPKDFFELLAIPFLGPKKMRVLYTELGIKSVCELRAAILGGMVQKLHGFGEKSAEKLMQGITIKAESKGRRFIGEVYGEVFNIVNNLRKCPLVIDAIPAGSFRRGEETVGDIDILVTGKNPGKIMKYFESQEYVKNILVRGDTKTSILTHDEMQVDLRVVEPSQFGSALQYFTGSKLHNVHLRTFAKNRGFKVSEYGFFKSEKLVASKTEKECYESLGMQYIPPELRSDTGEIEAAFKHKIPKDLVEFCDIKGDLHAHSSWSDGINTIEEMALAAHKKGYEYIAMTDHSPSLKIANGLDEQRVFEKKYEIEKLNDKLPIRILFGTEVDILADGTIDYPNEILKEFDVVVASIHSRFGQDNTDRILRAMENPFVHIIGHPSGRKLGERNPYPLDYEKVFKHAAETGTILEINSHYLRLDLRDIYIREAKKFGCLFSIDSDAHSTAGLGMVELGVKWARRGWAEKKDIVNTLTLQKLLKILK